MITVKNLAVKNTLCALIFMASSLTSAMQSTFKQNPIAYTKCKFYSALAWVYENKRPLLALSSSFGVGVITGGTLVAHADRTNFSEGAHNLNETLLRSSTAGYGPAKTVYPYFYKVAEGVDIMINWLRQTLSSIKG